MEESEIPKRLQKSIEAFGAWAMESMVSILSCHHARYAEQLCQSEIEKTFFLAWCALRAREEFLGSNYGGSADYIVHAAEFDGPLGRVDPKDESINQIDEIAAQYPVGRYRADFAICRKVRFYRQELHQSPIVIVECDGHDFHERTKEQAARDKRRDRELQLSGPYVLRFTGSEIFHDPNKCAEQVDEFLEEHIAISFAEDRKKRKAAALV